MKRIYLLLTFVMAWLPLWAQVSVSIQILPPYPTKITDYASQPQLMVIGVTNTSTTQQRIQLRGTVTGDNGIQLRVRDTYKSPQPIVLEPGQMRMLNGGDLKYFFDYTRIDYKGITQQDFINKNGLPEGTYRFCIRAYNYDSNAPISPDEPVGCSNTFTISSLEPPTIISPRPEQGIASNTGQTVLMQWSTPPGATQRVMTGVRYRIRMVEIRDNRNPNSAIQSQPYFFDREVMGNSYVFGPADPKLTPGRKYAFLVEASDPMNHTPFRNMGRSEVRTFTYLPSQTPAVPPVLANKPTQLPIIASNVSPACECHTETPAGTIANGKVNAATNKVVWVGGFKMEVQSIDAPSVNNGSISGTGVIGLPFVSKNPVPGAKLRVKFTNINVTEDGKMKDGLVEGIVNNAAASFIPTADNPTIPTLELPHDKAQGLEDYFNTHARQMLSAIQQSGDGAGFELPLGLSKGPVTVAMTHIYFNATQAWFDAAASMDVPDGNPADQSNILGFTGRNLCINTIDSFCKEGELVLSNDFTIPVIGLTLKKQGPDRAGTSITFNKSGFQKLHIDADYTFPDNSLIDYASNQPLTTQISTDSEPGSPNAWSDWTVAVKVNPFYVKGMRSIKFDLGGGSIFFDHSDYRNPQNMPTSFTSGDTGDAPIITSDKTWTGVYIPQINAYLPQIIKNTQSGDGLVKITGTNLLFDSNGFTGKIENTGATPPLALGSGSLDGWHASIDKVSLQFFRSAFKKSTMSGKVVLPASNISQASNQLDYDATLTTPGGSLAYSFNIHTKDNVSFDALYARVNLYDSQIEVHGDGSNPPSASATLNGSLSVANDPLSAVKIPGIGKLSLPHIAFTNLKLLTTKPFLDTTAFHAELTSANDPQGGGSPGMRGFDYIPEQDNLSGPNTGDLNNTGTVNSSAAFDGGDGTQQQSIAGFKFTAGYSGFHLMPNPVTGEYKVGLGFNGGLELGMGPVTVAAKAAFTLTSGIKKDGNFITWAGVGGKIDSIDFAGGADLGPFKIKGYVRYYNKPDDEGFVGALETDIASLVSVSMRAQFGNKKDSQGGFTYFNFDALADFGQTGITFAPPIPLAIYGFGGGIYFNMKQVSSLPNAANFPVAPRTQDVDTPPSTAKTSGDPKPNDNLENLLKSPSGMQLTPSRDTMGVSATILFGLTSRNTLDADATLSVELNKNTGGLGRITINSHARVLTDISRALSDRNKYSTGVGSLFIDMAPVDHSFTAHMDLELGVPFAKDSTLLHARGGGDFSWSPAGWYLRFGRPEGSGGQPNKITLFSILTGKSYFEVGSKVDDMPPIPSDVAELVGHGPHDQANKCKDPTPHPETVTMQAVVQSLTMG